jgi:hypothetical protein
MYGSLDQNMDDKFFIQRIFVIFQEVQSQVVSLQTTITY